jgi:NTE family protein
MATKRKTRIAIACQGGGSQTAFTAGALKALLQEGVHERFEIVSLSGTSGGAMCAALVWYALHKGDQEPWKRLVEFWEDNLPKSAKEMAFNRYLVDTLRMTNHGLMPHMTRSPTSPIVGAFMRSWSFGMRPTFTDMEGLLRAHIDFKEVKRWGALAKSPVLIIGAVEVLSGRLTTFSSLREPVLVQHVMASSTVPTLFPAVEIGACSYWDGVFSDNPPVNELVQPGYVGAANLPDEIWVVKINPTRCAKTPENPEEIVDRRNQLTGNISLFHQLDTIAWLNDLFLKGAIDKTFLVKNNIPAPVRIPKCYADDPDLVYHIPCIEMSDKLQSSLGIESKLDRSAENIGALMADGEIQAREFLEKRLSASTAAARRGSGRLRPPGSVPAGGTRGPRSRKR